MAQRLSAGTLRRLLTELGKLQSNPPEGISVTINEELITDISAVIDGPKDTPYEGGKFFIRLTIDENFPDTPPKGVFVTKIFHPNVSEHGEICVNTLKKDWQKHYGIEHVLITVKCLLIYPNPESALNEEAGRLLLERYDDYARHARIMTEIHAKPKSAKPELNSKRESFGNSGSENRDPALSGKPAPSIALSSIKDKRKKNLKRF
ncbi:ubiquitin-conjugating enzyme E2 S [Coemansia spiralis]|uniref:E2 ubiquitin-conjugating enzyme n=2 Tax=Coemansia TaxID=4863 RepID=A0A9W8FZU7_9FUNG|nr:ubiquitin-conjugating enzyme E2 S [Coemansia umbellata]KAJ2620505.1 ubiquitin-conjugating enzyme E2 S [Coemansia sp. RSA 1358]KAJ2673389.1 ubiquitin-conjugating enzyme E2 S [Coemansia spiralis]